MNSSKFIWYGIDEYSKKIFHYMPYLLKYIDCFFDEEQSQKFFMQKKVISNLHCIDNNNVLVFSANNEEKVTKLIKSYLNFCGTICASDWFASLIEKGMLIQPYKVRLESCSLCQLDCVTCYMRRKNTGNIGNGYLKYDDFVFFIKNNPFVKEIELSNNGEPFLNPDLLNILEYAYENKILITFSNGSNFNDVKYEILEALVKYNVRKIRISIDGASQSSYSRYRRNGNFNKVIENIKKLNNIKERYNSKTPHLTWQYILMEHNECDIENAVKMANELKMKLEFKLDWAGEYEPLDPKYVTKFTNLTIYNRKQWHEANGSYFANKMCSEMLFQPQINYDGRLLGCCCVYMSDWNINVFDENLTNALNNTHYKQILIDFLKGNYNFRLDSMCKDCSANNHNLGERQQLII